MNSGHVICSFYTTHSLDLTQSIFQLLNIRTLTAIKVYFASKQSLQVFAGGSSLWSELAASEISNSFPGEKVLSTSKCLRDHYHAGKHLNICNIVEIDTCPVLSMYFDELF